MKSSQYTKGVISEAVLCNVKYSICSLALFFYSSLWVWLFCVRFNIKGADKSSQPYGISLIGLYPKPETRFLTPYVRGLFVFIILFRWDADIGGMVDNHCLNIFCFIMRCYEYSNCINGFIEMLIFHTVSSDNINCQLNSYFVGIIAKVKLLCIQEIFNIQIRKSTSPLQCWDL